MGKRRVRDSSSIAPTLTPAGTAGDMEEFSAPSYHNQWKPSDIADLSMSANIFDPLKQLSLASTSGPTGSGLGLGFGFELGFAEIGHGTMRQWEQSYPGEALECYSITETQHNPSNFTTLKIADFPLIQDRWISQQSVHSFSERRHLSEEELDSIESIGEIVNIIDTTSTLESCSPSYCDHSIHNAPGHNNGRRDPIVSYHLL